ncbi:hypothetical protein J6S88_07730 [bacterium]|nr:hypothetical protein [bacterium]
MKKETNLDKFKACIDKEVKAWNMTTLSELEKFYQNKMIVWGIMEAALYILPFKDYQTLIQYVYDKYGYNYGSAITKDDDAAG